MLDGKHRASVAIGPALMVSGGVLLSSCGMASNGACTMPPNDHAAAEYLKERTVGDVFERQRITDVRPRYYVARNRQCCSVEPAGYSFLDWLLWERSSLPKYQVDVNVAYARGPTTFIYHEAGLGDSCGRVPDPYGSEAFAGGPKPLPQCRLTSLQLAGPLRKTCTIDRASDPPAHPVALAPAMRAYDALLAEQSRKTIAR